MGKTVNGRQFQDTKIQNGLVFSDLRGKNRVQLPKVFTSEDLSQREDLFSHKVVHKWKHLKSTADDLPPQIPGAKIGDIHCAFLMEKARVAPVKTATTPRLELIAAAISVRVGDMITRELEEPVESKFCWSDSTTVLKYKRNVKKLFHLFVDTMRIAAIQMMTHHLERT